MKVVFLLSLFILVACSSVISTVTVDVEGIKHDVETLKAHNSYKAYKTNWSERTKWGINPNDFILNVKAIEAATGCKADPTSIYTQAFFTVASVNCGNPPVP